MTQPHVEYNWALRYLNDIESRFGARMHELELEFAIKMQETKIELELEFALNVQQLRSEFQQELQNLQNSVAPPAPMATAPQPRMHTEATQPSPRGLPDGAADMERAVPALAAVAQAARWAAREAGGAPELLSLLRLSFADRPYDVKAIATAYDQLHKADLHSERSKREQTRVTDDPGSTSSKHALRVIRDLFVLRVCIGRGPWDKPSFKNAMKEAFGREFTTPDDERMGSQLVLAFNQVMKLGMDRGQFDTAVAQMYGAALEQPLIDQLFQAYEACANTSPGQRNKKTAGRGPADTGQRLTRRDTAPRVAWRQRQKPRNLLQDSSIFLMAQMS